MSQTAHPALPADAVEVGRVIGAWGIKGAIKVLPFSSAPEALFSTKRWHIRPAVVQRPVSISAVPMPELLRVVQAREHGDGIVANVQDVDDRTAAEALAGARVFISRTSFPTPDENEFYWVDLIGLDVVNREGLALGTVVGLIETGPHCVLRIHPHGKVEVSVSEECLVPFVGAYVDDVDREARRITVDWLIDY